MNNTEPLLTIVPSKYGVTEQKKSELDRLNNEVLNAQDEVEQLQAIADSLQEKSAKFLADLNSAEANKDTALNNKKMMDALIKEVNDLQNNSGIAFDEMVIADAKIQQLAIQMKKVIDELIYSAEVINKLGNLVVRKKALNPLISDELVSMITKAGTDANNAVALTLVALKSTFSAQATSVESEAAAALEYTESMKLYEVMTGTQHDGKKSDHHDKCLEVLIDKAFTDANNKYLEAEVANKEVLKQLNITTANLTKAQVKLKSLQAGLAAANAAALAS